MKNRNKLIAICMVATVLILIAIDTLLTKTDILENYGEKQTEIHYEIADAIITGFAEQKGLDIKDWPVELRALLERNPETKDFVLNYPLKKDEETTYTLSEYSNPAEIPHFMQWDMRWGYEEYAGSIMGLSGCGPVCLSMVSIYLLNDISFDPLYIARFAEKEGYATSNNGTKWILMSEGAEKLGLKSEELPLDKNVMINALSEGKPIICIMGAGDFTSSGHYIVLTGYSEDGFSVLDPNSSENSSKIWQYEKIEKQIRNIWAFSIKEAM